MNSFLKLEENIYDFGHVCYRLGRMETDGNSSTKEYNKISKQKEDLMKFFDDYFSALKKTSKKEIKTTEEQNC